ncbi:MAG TPA: Lar family restriction alleviation protein [Hymenobacter sp.]|jgi:hypothetical protein
MKIKKSNPLLKAPREALNITLETCPFCGSKAELDTEHDDVYNVNCIGCTAQIQGDTIGGDGDEFDHKLAMADAVAAWNERA